MPKLELPIHFADHIAKALGWPIRQVKEWFDFEEDKQGFFTAILKPKLFLSEADFKTMCRLTRDLGGEYVQGQRVWRVPGPYAETEKPAAPNEPSQPAPVKPGYYPEYPIDRILSPKFCFRVNIEEGIQQLMAEIHAAGCIIEPLVARPVEQPLGYIEVGPGERRLLAARMLGMEAVPVVVREFTDEEFDRVRMLENLARKDLSDYEIARAIQYLMKTYPEQYPTHEAIAQVFGKSREWVTNHLRLLKLETDYNVSHETLEKITEYQAREILAAPEEKRQELLKQVAETGEIPSAREIRRATQPTVTCARCGKPVDMPVHLAGKFYCEACAREVQLAEKGQTQVPSLPEGSFREEPVEAPSQEPKPEEIDTGFQWECPECHQKFQLIHVNYPDGKVKHKLEPYAA